MMYGEATHAGSEGLADVVQDVAGLRVTVERLVGGIDRQPGLPRACPADQVAGNRRRLIDAGERC